MNAFTRTVAVTLLAAAASSQTNMQINVQFNQWTTTIQNTVNFETSVLSPVSTWASLMSGMGSLNAAISLLKDIWGWTHPTKNPLPEIMADLTSIQETLYALKEMEQQIMDTDLLIYTKWNDIVIFLKSKTTGMNNAVKKNPTTIPGQKCYQNTTCLVAMNKAAEAIRNGISEFSLVTALHDAVVSFENPFYTPNNLQRYGYYKISTNFPYSDGQWNNWKGQLQKYNGWLGYLVNKIQQMQLLILFAKSWIERPNSTAEPYTDAFDLIEQLNKAIGIMVKAHWDSTAWSRTATGFYDRTFDGSERVFKLYQWNEGKNYPNGNLGNNCYRFVNDHGMVAQTCRGYRDFPVQEDVYLYPVLDDSATFNFVLYDITLDWGESNAVDCVGPYSQFTLYFADIGRLPGYDYLSEWSCHAGERAALKLNFWPVMHPKDPCYFGVWDKVRVQVNHFLVEEHINKGSKYWDFVVIPAGWEPNIGRKQVRGQSCQAASLYECAQGWEDSSNTGFSEKQKCLAGGPGYVYTGGDPSKAPGCIEHCKCCKPLDFSGGVMPQWPERETRDVAPTPPGQDKQLYECYHWSAYDLAKELPEQLTCEDAGYGLVYTGGDDSKAPGCGTCSCCQLKQNPVDVPRRFGTRFQCHHYTNDEIQQLKFGVPESIVCQSAGHGFLYTAGQDRLAPGCGGCYCCKPDTPPGTDLQFESGGGEWGGLCRCPSGKEYMVGDNGDACGSLACEGGEMVSCNKSNGEWSKKSVKCAPGDAGPFECYHYSDADLALLSQLGVTGWGETAAEQAVCLSAGYGFVFTDGNESLAPGCDNSCHCCQPAVKTAERYVGYTFSEADMNMGLSEMERCLTSGVGFVYASDGGLGDGVKPYGNPAVAPGCDRGYKCCKPEIPAKDRFECHQWTDYEKNLINVEHKDEYYVCRVNSGGVYTKGDVSLAPGCGRCFCCTPLPPH